MSRCSTSSRLSSSAECSDAASLASAASAASLASSCVFFVFSVCWSSDCCVSCNVAVRCASSARSSSSSALFASDAARSSSRAVRSYDVFVSAASKRVSRSCWSAAWGRRRGRRRVRTHTQVATSGGPEATQHDAARGRSLDRSLHRRRGISCAARFRGFRSARRAALTALSWAWRSSSFTNCSWRPWASASALARSLACLRSVSAQSSRHAPYTATSCGYLRRACALRSSCQAAPRTRRDAQRGSGRHKVAPKNAHTRVPRRPLSPQVSPPSLSPLSALPSPRARRGAPAPASWPGPYPPSTA
eukprot:7378336-Prymnesium_polylepis.1